MADPPKRRATYDDVRAVPEQLVAELVDGELVTSPRPAALHARVRHAWLVDPSARLLEALQLDGEKRRATSFGRTSALAFSMALAFGASCGTSKHAADDEGGPRAEGGEGSEIAGSGGDDGVGGSAGASGGRGGSAGDAGGGAGSNTTGGASTGDAGRGGASGGEPATAGDAGRGGMSGAGGKNGTGGIGGTGPRPTFSPKLACDAPRWLTTVVQPLEATAPLAVTNGLGVFMVTTMISEEVNAFETWDNTVFSMERDGLYPNPLQNTVGEGSHPRVGQLAMGRTGDGLWIQNPGIVGSSATTTLRRWDQAANAWDDPHPIPGMRASTMRAAFLDDHDVVVTGLMDEDIVSVVYDHESSTWSEPEPIGKLGTSVVTNWGLAHFTLTADGAGNAAAVWARDETSGVRVMREGSWVGSAVSLPVDGMVLGFWDIGVVPAGSGNFEIVAGPQDQTRGVMMKAWTLAYDESAGTVLDEPADAGTLPMVINVSTGQPLTLQRDVDGDLTVAARSGRVVRSTGCSAGRTECGLRRKCSRTV